MAPKHIFFESRFKTAKNARFTTNKKDLELRVRFRPPAQAATPPAGARLQHANMQLNGERERRGLNGLGHELSALRAFYLLP